MNIKTFLKKSIQEKITIQEQEFFLENKKDISAKELASAVEFLLKQMPFKLNLKDAIDVCGTGGSGLERINTSTISAFILASLGIKVAKHGNKAASGRYGSFDLLENLGVEILGEKEAIQTTYQNNNLVFLFARNFHPVMKYFAEVRKKTGKPTFFNILGPLLNPAQTKRQIIGTTFKKNMAIMAEACRILGKERVYIVCGEDGLDEVTLTGKTFVTELNHGKIKNHTISPKDFGVRNAKFKEIKGGNAETNTKIALDIIEGKCQTRHLDLVLVNCALALKLCGKAKTLKEGYAKAKRAVVKGEVLEKYTQYKAPNILNKIIKTKKIKKKNLGKIFPSDRDFYAAINKKGISLIAEIKRKSPSNGNLSKTKFSPSKIAKYYEKSGAAAISVLCDKKFFGGDVKHMMEARKSTKNIPILCKDFIIDEYQIYEARKYGADAILLIAAILSEEKIKKFTEIAKKLKMAVLCEVHTLEELKKVLKTPVKIIGINNRDLKTFKIDLKTTTELSKHIPQNKLIVSESGISSKSDIVSLPKRVKAILVGATLMKGEHISNLINP